MAARRAPPAAHRADTSGLSLGPGPGEEDGDDSDDNDDGQVMMLKRMMIMMKIIMRCQL